MSLPKLNAKEKAVVEAYMTAWIAEKEGRIPRLMKTITELTARNQKLEKKLLTRTQKQ